MNTRVLVIKAKNCTGCHLCELACSSIKEGEIFPALSRIKVITDGLNGWSSPVVCMHCKNPSCLAVCSVGALFESETPYGDKFIDVNGEKCVACHKCVLACPFGAIEYVKDIGIVKCDLCGGKPLCVEFCSYNCLEFIELTEEQYQNHKVKLNVLVVKTCQKISKQEPAHRRKMFSLDLSKS